MAKLLIFRFSYIKQFFFWLFVEELAYSWPACFENLSLSLLYSSLCLSVQDGFGGKTLHQT